MTILETDSGYEIENGSKKMVVQSIGMGGKASTNYQGNELEIKVKATLMHLITPNFTILKNGKTIGKISRKYFGGNFIIALAEGGIEQKYLVKTSRKKFELLDASKKSLLTISSNFSLRQQKSDYTLQASSILRTKSNNMELIFYSMFCLFYYDATVNQLVFNEVGVIF